MTHTTSPKGNLEVICGPMFSGKSEELIRRIKRAKIARQGVATFKHHFDNRTDITCVVSHDGNKVSAQPVDQVDAIAAMVSQPDIHVVGIDEVQFFPNKIVSVILDLVDAGKRVIVAGLDLDFRGVPFGCMPALLAVADSVTKLEAICSICGQNAHFSQRLINEKPARYDDPIIMIGAQEAYQARCRCCFSIDRKPVLHE